MRSRLRSRQNERNAAGDMVTEMPGQQAALGGTVERYDEPTVQLLPPVTVPGRLRVCAASLIGGRTYQQDTMWFEGRRRELPEDEEGAGVWEDFLAVVCDGMGGLEGGERASACAIDRMSDCYRQEEIPISNVPAFFFQAMQVMNRDVCSLEDEQGRPFQSGSTAVAVYICEDKLYWFSIGDSKIYFLRQGSLTCPFLPHNYRTQLEQELREGRMTQEEFLSEMKKGEALISFLGMGRIHEYEISGDPFILEKGDVILLCSDGLYKALTEQQIMNLVEIGREDFETTANLLAEAVRSYGKPPIDNVSVICIGYDV